MTRYISGLPRTPGVKLAEKAAGDRINHYLVVIGYDDIKHLYIVSDPARKAPVTITTSLFEAKWAECSYLTILIAPGKNDNELLRQ